MQQPTSSTRLRPFRPTPFGRYTLLMPLSIGGMGEIFLARLEGAQGFEKLCVIKKILPHLAEDKDFVSRFVNEARTLVKLTHGSIAQVLDMGLHLEEPYLALEYIDGKDLRKVGARFRERGMPLPLTFVLFVMGRVLDALAYAHRKRDDEDKEIGLVHRDMSPQNILISYEGEVKVIDFGLAKSTLNASKTNPSIILGKFLYMSPEQARHGKVDRRSDLYSVGLCLYELIAGKNPFEDVPPHALMAAVASPTIAHVQTVEPLTPTNIANIIMKALAVDPAQRFQTAEELRGKLLGALLEIDPSAGPESCTRFMRDMFAAEYQSERKLLAQLKEAARAESKPETPAVLVRPLHVAKPRVDNGPSEESTPAPTDLRRYGMEPTIPRAMALDTAALSFAPTPKVGGHAGPSPGERETVPGIVVDRAGAAILRPGRRGDAGEGAEDGETTPHVVFSGKGAVGTSTGTAITSPDLLDSLPTRPVQVTGVRGAAPAAATSGNAFEPVTSEMPIVPGVSEEDLPSVMVNGIAAQTLSRPLPMAPRSSAGRPQVSQVLVPASSVRTPEVVGPLPKALEGRHRPDENLTTDRGTRARRGNMLVALPLLAILAVVAVFGFLQFKKWADLEAEEEAQTKQNQGSSLGPSTGERRTVKQPAPPPVAVPEEAPVVDVVESDPPKIEEVDDTGVEPVDLPPSPVAPKATVSRTRALATQCIEKAHKSAERKRQLGNLRGKLDALANQLDGLPVSNEAKLLQECTDLSRLIEKAK